MTIEELFEKSGKEYLAFDIGKGTEMLNVEQLKKRLGESIPIEAPVKPACERCKWIEKQLKKVIAYPTKAQGRRTKDGYPSELIYDEYRYKRMIDSFRQALKDILKDSKSV